MATTSTDRRQGVNVGAAVKVPVRVATTANITLSGLQTIDGVTVASGDRVLVKNQTTGSENGIYTADSGSWERDKDFDGAYDVRQGTLVLVTNGTTNGDTMWRVSTSGTITPGSTSISFTRALVNSADTVGFTQAGTGAVSRSSQDKMRELFSVKDFGAVGDGVTNDTSAFTTAVAAALAAGKGLFVPAGTYLATVSIRGNNFSLIGEGSGVTTIKHPVTTLANVVELGDTASGNSATAYSKITVRGITIDGNRSALTAPTSDLVGHGLPLTNVSNFHISDVRAINCYNAGFGVFITSNYGYAEVYVENCGNATYTGPGFDINSSSRGVYNIVSKSCYIGGRVLDNSFGNNIRIVSYGATSHGFVLNNQSVNESYVNVIEATIEDCGGSGFVVGPNCHDNQIRATVKNAGSRGLDMATQSTSTRTFDGSSGAVVSTANDTIAYTAHGWSTGTKVVYSHGGGTAITGLTSGNTYWIIRVDADTVKLASSASNASVGTAINLTALGVGTTHTLKSDFASVANTITLNTYNSAGSGLYLGGHSNLVIHSSNLDGRSGAPGDFYAVDIYGDNNNVTVNLIDSDTWKTRGIAVRAGATDNVIDCPSYVHTLSSQVIFSDTGTRTRFDTGGGEGASIASATTIDIPPVGVVFHITGTTAITTMSGAGAPRMITLIFDGALTFTDGSNLKIAGNFSTSADDTITGWWDGTNFYEVARSAN